MALVVALAAVAAAEAVVAAAEVEVLVVVVLEKEIVSRRVQVTLSDHYMFKPEILSPIPPTPKLKSESLNPQPPNLGPMISRYISLQTQIMQSPTACGR